MRKLSVYILKEFLFFLGYSILAFLVIFILVDVVDHIDQFIDRNFGLPVIFLYYVVYLPYIIVLTLPVAMLLATMFSLGRLVGDNEITAIKASGISLYRILLPLYVFSLLMGFVVMGLTEIIVPRANLLRQDIKDQGKNFKFSLSKSREGDRSNVYLMNDDGRIIYAGRYNSRKKIARSVSIIELSYNDSTNTANSDGIAEIISRTYAKSMDFKDGIWILHDVEVRTFFNEHEKLEHTALLPDPLIKRKPTDFATIHMQPEEMNYFQLKRYIDDVKKKGGDASGWKVDLFLKISFPFVAFVIVFFGAPMAAGSTNRGKTASFGIALVISFVFYTLINTIQILGRSKTLDPFAAAWLPNGLFLIIGLFMHHRARK